MPPSDGPITAASFLMPSETATSCPARAMSSTVSTGNVSRYGWPVAGLIEIGEVEPNGLPSELTQMTKQRRVSIGRPGPIMSSHQPGAGSSVDDAACAEGDSPVKIRTALSWRTAGSPQVSYAISTLGSAPPRRIGNGCCSFSIFRAVAMRDVSVNRCSRTCARHPAAGYAARCRFSASRASSGAGASAPGAA